MSKRSIKITTRKRNDETVVKKRGKNNATQVIQYYPLYDELAKRVDDRSDNSGIDLKRVCTTINCIAQLTPAESAYNHYSEIGAIILHYDLLENNGVLLSSVPYEGRVVMGGKGIIYYIANMPPKLQQIIAQYIELCRE